MGNNVLIPKLATAAACAVAVLLLLTSQHGPHHGRFLVACNTFTAHTELLAPEDQKNITRLGLTPKNVTIVKDTNGFSRKIHGRFVHITDMHPDPYYKVGSDIETELCHGGKGDASKYGNAVGGCDSPMVLMEDTIQWIKDNLKDKVDFVLWTGDNIRHDNDRRYPRSEMHIFDMNQEVADLMYKTFKNNKNPDDPRDMLVDLIPSLGNNDVYPHNLFSPGPTLQTREFYKIWSNFIPQLQLHTFARGAYFFQEVVPGELAVLSVNTLYWFQSNPLVDSCDNKKDPGYKLFEWLGYVLKELRQRNMKVWLSGHVPPNEKNYDLTCLRKYIVWTYEYRDIIIGGVYGHMNIDHFIPLDSKAAYKSLKGKLAKLYGAEDVALLEELDDDYDFEYDSDFDSDSDSDDEDEDIDESLEDLYRKWNVTIHEDVNASTFTPSFYSPSFSIQGGIPHNKVDYLNSLRELYYAAIKKKKRSGVSSERYAVAHVTASIVPTFNPGLRVWEYNTTNLAEAVNSKIKYAEWDEFFAGVNQLIEQNTKLEEESERIEDHEPLFSSMEDPLTTFKKDKTIPPKKPKNLPLGPAYVPQLFTPERYVQYFVDLKGISEGKKEFGFEIEYMTDDKDYDMENLTVDEWLKFGRKLGKPVKALKEKAAKKKKKKKNKNKKNQKEDRYAQLEDIWKSYLRHSFIDSDYEHMGL